MHEAKTQAMLPLSAAVHVKHTGMQPGAIITTDSTACFGNKRTFHSKSEKGYKSKFSKGGKSNGFVNI